jgi:serine phosphatase RsbU (regulator of sigma subunit)
MSEYKTFFHIKNFFYIVFTLFFFSNNLFSQENTSVYLNQIEKEKSDTAKVTLYLKLSREYVNFDNKKSLQYVLEAEKLALKTNYKIHKVYSALSRRYLSLYDFKRSSDYAHLTLKEAKKIKGDERHTLEGTIYEILSSINTQNGNIGLAIKYQKEAIDAFQNLDDKEDYWIANINLAKTYVNQLNYEQALKTYALCEKNIEQIIQYSTYVYNGIAVCYKKTGKLEKAIEYYEKAKNAVHKYAPNDISSIAVVQNNIGLVQISMGHYLSAIINFSEALEIFKKIEDQISITEVYYNLAESYKLNGQPLKSNEYLSKYVDLKDSIFDAESKEIVNELSIKYETEKKEQENKILSKENENKQLVIYFSTGGIAMVLLILLIILRNNRIKQRINQQLKEKNKLIEEQKEIVEEQHNLLEEKNKEITDSIKYAERIQGAILPPEQKWNYILPSSFVLNKPKDILSGDFYWVADTETHIFVAAADCTGHGVPGALISIVNFNLLNKAVLEKSLTCTAEILDTVNIWLTESLNQDKENSTIKDGMDISLISINKQNGKIEFTGANNPLYLFSGDEMIEIKGDKFPVGAFIDEEIRHFTTQEINPKFGDTIYLFSDGFADQFGGPNGKKYKYKTFKELLFRAKELPIIEQKEFLYQEFKSWKGKIEQTDDVLVIGLKIT